MLVLLPKRFHVFKPFCYCFKRIKITKKFLTFKLSPVDWLPTFSVAPCLAAFESVRTMIIMHTLGFLEFLAIQGLLIWTHPAIPTLLCWKKWTHTEEFKECACVWLQRKLECSYWNSAISADHTYGASISRHKCKHKCRPDLHVLFLSLCLCLRRTCRWSSLVFFGKREFDLKIDWKTSKPKGVTIQMKALDEYIRMVLFVLVLKILLYFCIF